MDASSLLQNFSIRNENLKYKSILIGQYGSLKYRNKRIQEDSLNELILLADTAGVSNSHELFFYVPVPTSNFFLTRGHLAKVKEEITTKSVNLLILDAELKPRQLRNLEEELKVRVIGRIELILDIFAMRAKTKEASLQVELAQLTYILPRLKGLGGVLSRLGGGIGTRGPGETMLEKDRRHIRRRIQRIKLHLKDVSRHRNNLRKNRNIPTFALVGYTNAGKTTLINKLSSSPKKLFAEDRLFATLDSFSRKVFLKQNNGYPSYCIMIDTIGFIRNLPSTLIAAFQSTIEEIFYTDAVILVIDASQPGFEEEIAVVEGELEKIGISDKKKIIFFNKTDIMFPEELKILKERYNGAIFGSALTENGLITLCEQLYEFSYSKEEEGAYTHYA